MFNGMIESSKDKWLLRTLIINTKGITKCEHSVPYIISFYLNGNSMLTNPYYSYSISIYLLKKKP